MPSDMEQEQPGRVTLGWSGKTDPGRVRPNNEDSFLALTFDGKEMQFLGRIGQTTVEQNDCIFAVSDGMGGAKSGEFASRLTVDGITRLLPKGFRLSAAGLSSGFSDLLEELFSEIPDDMSEPIPFTARQASLLDKLDESNTMEIRREFLCPAENPDRI